MSQVDIASVNVCLIVPHYNHAAQFAVFLPQLAALSLPILVVDDGSDEQNQSTLDTLLAEYPQVACIKHATNRGKGAAVISAFYWARANGFTHVLQIDADGQHAVSDVARFIQAAQDYPQTILSGKPVFDDSVPKARLYGRKVTDFWVMLETWSLIIKDGLCGFRIYPLDQMELLLDKYHFGPRMEFDTELLVKAVWQDIPLKYINTAVIYPENSVSHFRYLQDNCQLIALHTRLMLGMLWRAPRLIGRRLVSVLGKQ